MPVLRPMVKALKRFGQHFLEPAWVRKVVEEIAPAPTQRFLEVGPGTGALTFAIAARAAAVVAIEIDRALARRLRAEAPRNVRIVEADVLRADLAGFVSELLGNPDFGDAPACVRLVGNLPYNVSSPVLFRLLTLAGRTNQVADATLMLQEEVAERVLAGPGSGEYSPLSIMVRLRSEPRMLLRLPPGAFRPAPRVRSALVRLEFRSPGVSLSDEQTFNLLVRSVFTQRRKTLSNALRPFAVGRDITAVEALEAAGLDGRRRPETLSLGEFATLSNVFARR